MSIDKYINAVKVAPIILESHEGMNTVIAIEVQDEVFYGIAECHEDDVDFYSPIVGGTIAHMRAMLMALDYKLWEMEATHSILKQTYCGITQSYHPAVADPTGKFKLHMFRAENKVKKLREAKRALKKELNTYIQDHSKAIELLQRSRAKLDN